MYSLLIIIFVPLMGNQSCTIRVLNNVNVKKTILFLSLIALCINNYAGVFVDVKIFTGYRITSITVTPVIGKYALFNSDKKVADVLKNETIKLTLTGTYGIQVQKNNQDLGVFSLLSISGTGLINAMQLKSLSPELKTRTYDDDFRISVINGIFLILNHVDIEHYVAGVVQSEGGGSIKDNEFYIVQAICCRTYALNNVKKHSKDGYNLCDSIHCQLYGGRCQNSDILMAVFRTQSDVIVDKDGKMISAAFHSNSGGETANSEDVWSIPTTYLKSTVDTFSLKMPDAKWEKTMPADEWLNYLSLHFHYPINDNAKRAAALNFTQEHRGVFFCDSIRLTSIRADLGLRSAFFTIKQAGNSVIFSGKGYGHGVGMSQQGAIYMARMGYSYKDIIKFYYKDVDIVNYEQLMIKNN
jgi:stage II sporulation protein D